MANNQLIISTYKADEGVKNVAFFDKDIFDGGTVYDYVIGLHLSGCFEGVVFQIVDGDTGEILYDTRDDDDD